MEIQESKNVVAVPDTDEKLFKAEIKTTSPDVIWEELERDQKNPEKDNNVRVLKENETHSDSQETQDKNMKNLLKNKNEIDTIEAATTKEDNRTEANENGSTDILAIEAYEKHETENNEKNSSVASASEDGTEINSFENRDESKDDGEDQFNNVGESDSTSVASDLDVMIQDEAVNYSRNRNVRAPFSGGARAAGAPRTPSSSGASTPVSNPDKSIHCGWAVCFWLFGLGTVTWFVFIYTGGGKIGGRLIRNSTTIDMANVTEFGMNNITDIGTGHITSAASSLVGDYAIWILGMYAILHMVEFLLKTLVRNVFESRTFMPEEY